MVNKNSTPYKIGRVIERLGLVLAGYMFGKRWGRLPTDDFPKKHNH